MLGKPFAKGFDPRRGPSRKIHGEGPRGLNTPEYQAWASMKNRCRNPKYHLFSDYGGRGIAVCERWLNSYPNFLADMGRRPSPQHSLDRIDVNGNYEPSNCRWATATEQRRNRRDSKLYEFRGERHTLTEIASMTGLKMGTIWARLKSGWPESRAFSVVPVVSVSAAEVFDWCAERLSRGLPVVPQDEGQMCAALRASIARLKP